jgi:PAS domain-containing protein
VKLHYRPAVVQFREPTLWQQYRWLILSVAGLLVAQSLVIGYVLVQNRRRRAAEISLKESEERMTFTAAAANVGLWQFDRRSNRLWATEHCRALFGLGKDVPLRRDTLLAAVHPEDRAAAIAWFRDARSVRDAGSDDFRVIGPGDRVRWLHVRADSSLDNGDGSGRLSGIFIDVTDQKAAEAEARAAPGSGAPDARYCAG